MPAWRCRLISLAWTACWKRVEADFSQCQSPGATRQRENLGEWLPGVTNENRR